MPEINPSEVQEILASQPSIESSDTRRSLRVREDVYVPLVFHKGAFIAFKRKHLLFLEAFKPGVSLAKAAEVAGLTPKQAIAFLRRKDVRLWLHDLGKEAAIKRDWDRPEKWYAIGAEWMEGKRAIKNEFELEVWKEFGARVAPKPSRNAPSQGPVNVNINVNPSSVDAAFSRQQVIDAEISQQKAS